MKCHICYNQEEPPKFFKKSVYLAGTNGVLVDRFLTNEDGDITSSVPLTWRDEALKYLQDNFDDGVVFVPQDNPDPSSKNKFPNIADKKAYTKQIEWERKWMTAADAVVFWLPRSMSNIGLVSNVELGGMLYAGNIFVGAPYSPGDQDKNAYIRTLLESKGRRWYSDLKTLITDVVTFIGDGETREGSERKIPLGIWKDKSFQDWKKDVETSSLGSNFRDFEVLWSASDTIAKKPFLWIVKPIIHVSEEHKIMDNEFVIGRTALTSVCIYTNDTKLEDTRVVLVKEFRNAGRSKSGYVLGLPSGSLHEGMSMVKSALKEVEEETGVVFENTDAAKMIGDKQTTPSLVATSNRAYKYGVSSASMDEIARAVRGETFGLEEEDEKTYVVIKTWKQIIRDKLVDWSTLGMISQALNEKEE